MSADAVTSSVVAPPNDVCKICAERVVLHGRATVRCRYDAAFLRCKRCGFICVADPVWLSEAYQRPINDSDTGYLARNLSCAERVRMLIELCLDPEGKYLDYAAGYGVFVRLMRDLGYDFRWTDAYCENLFARHFEEGQPLTSTFTGITAFEVLEHLVDPMQTLEELARLSSCLIVSTDLVPEAPPAPGEWWYYGLEHGQHVSFYALSTLRVVAERLNMSLSTDGACFHVFTKTPIPPRVFRRIDSRFWRAVIARIRKRDSKREADHDAVVKIHSGSFSEN